MNRFKKIDILIAPFKSTNISLYASSATFYLCLSFLPTTMLLCSFMPKLLSISSLQNTIAGAIPSSFHPLIQYLLEKLYSTPSLYLLSISAFTGLWSASKGVLALTEGINATLNIPKTDGYIKRHLVAVIYFLILSICLVLILSLLVFAEMLRQFLLRYFPASGKIVTALFQFRGITAFVLLTGVFTFMYRILPKEDFPFIGCLQSAALVSAGWVIFSFGFSIYIRHITKVDHIYGGIGLLLLAGIWLKTCISLLLYGTLYMTAKKKLHYRPFQIIRQFFKP